MNQETFDKIAASWYNYRHWSRFTIQLETLAKRWKRGKLLNLGCAHGPDFLPFKDNFALYGVDYSKEMLKYAKRYADKFGFSVDLIQGDVTRLPYANETFEWAISVATYHHIITKKGRQAAFKELWRILKYGGEAFLTVWNKWQPRFWFRPKEIMIPWKTRDEVLNRYYYLFSPYEFKKLAKSTDFKIINPLSVKFNNRGLQLFLPNIYLTVKKS